MQYLFKLVSKLPILVQRVVLLGGTVVLLGETSAKAFPHPVSSHADSALESSPVKLAVTGKLPQRTARQQQSQSQPQSRYNPPPDRGTPPSTTTTGSRGNCFYHRGRPPLAALVGAPHLSQTISQRPTVWIYSPYSADEAPQAELIIQTEATDQELYRGKFQLQPQPGIQGIQIPTSIASLEVGQSYRWYIDIYCRDNNGSISSASSTPATLTGIIELVEVPADLERVLQQAGQLEAINLYGSNHLWYDMLTAIARQKLQHPDDVNLQNDWSALLQDSANVGLGFLSQEPLISELSELEAIK